MSFSEFNALYIWGWPFIILLFVLGLIITIAFKGIQFTHFFTSWRYVLFPPKVSCDTLCPEKQTISPIQAFLGMISASLGNGSLAGMAVAMHAGGPGAGFWLLVFGLLAVPMRFLEVLAASVFTVETEHGRRGGPMVYLARVFGGSWLPHVFAFFCFLYCLFAASAMQGNSMATGLTAATGINELSVALMLLLFLAYTFFGGAERIVKLSEMLAPLKVGLFMVATGAVLVTFAPNFIPALRLIFTAAFSSTAIAGGFAGHVMQKAIGVGASRIFLATEAGGGTAAIMFGATGGGNPRENSIMSMALVFTTQLVCFCMFLMFTMSGTWNSGLTSTPLVMSTYATVFGGLGSAVALFLSILFGLGVLVGYAFIGRETWLFLTRGRIGDWPFMILYSAMAAFGALGDTTFVFAFVDLSQAAIIFLNLYGLVMLLPSLLRKWKELDNVSVQ